MLYNILRKSALLLTFAALMNACQSDQTANKGTENEATTNNNNTSDSGKNGESVGPQISMTPISDLSYVETSQYLLRAAQASKSTNEYAEKLAVAPKEALRSELNTDDERLAFWVNVYNAYIITILRAQPDLYDEKGDFFGKNQVMIAGEALSFDKIEHGIIRSSTMKLSKGYIGKFFPGQFEKDFRVEDKDPRIHFALNCGAIDCPPVYVYNPGTIDKDFDDVAKAYLKKMSTYDAAKNEVTTTPLFNWFTGDFGGKDGVREMLYGYGILPAEKYKKTSLEYRDYDWTLDRSALALK